MVGDVQHMTNIFRTLMQMLSVTCPCYFPTTLHSIEHWRGWL